jgi:hypothetical protein
MTRILLSLGIGIAVTAGAGIQPATAAPNPINPELAQTYHRITMVDLDEATVDADGAISKLNALSAKDAGNATRYYVLAAACVWKDDWDKVSQYLELGHWALYCIQYQRNAGPDRYTPAYATYRRLARACRDTAPNLGVEKGAKLLQSIRKMAKKIAGTEPRSVMGPLVGISIRKIVNQTLVELCESESPEGVQARKLQAADDAFGKAVTAESNAKMGKDLGQALVALGRKHGVTTAQIIAQSRGETASPAVRAKLDKMTKELEAKERPLVARWLKAMPD